jgi:hypothetical protein
VDFHSAIQYVLFVAIRPQGISHGRYRRGSGGQNAKLYERSTNSLCEIHVACFLMVCTHESHQPANSEGCKSRGCCDDTDADPSPGSRLYSFAFSRRPHICIPPARHDRLDSVAGSSQRQATRRSRRRLLEDSPVSRAAIERVVEHCRAIVPDIVGTGFQLRFGNVGDEPTDMFRG